jgi:hypothetical protein
VPGVYVPSPTRDVPPASTPAMRLNADTAAQTTTGFNTSILDRSLDTTFESSQLSISSRARPYGNVLTANWAHGVAWQTDTDQLLNVETLDMNIIGVNNPPAIIARLYRGYFQEISVDASGAAQPGFYFALQGIDLDRPDKIGFYRVTNGNSAMDIAPNDGDMEYWTHADFVFLDDPNSAPLIFATTDTRVCFLPNVVYDKTTTSIVRQIFTGGMPDAGSSPWRKPVWVRGTIIVVCKTPKHSRVEGRTCENFQLFT